ncbi:hypothetical protein [Corynebacterium pseudotuberculosis]|uniref:hypothetical protein n=1 Tax=Corynebacterium pseudotuberculosis TaxID=1719 RepID=UPI0002660E8C|nr:hypothetical protein [Corynebacterium pseudotuberculosis]AFM07040.1 hypothetical protein CP162_03505 [Corynebacterium pseudotuberculosis Cp162]WFP67835.1 hypothetical protein P8128_03470 [Corynebacterium pseudotuberculosis]
MKKAFLGIAISVVAVAGLSAGAFIYYKTQNSTADAHTDVTDAPAVTATFPITIDGLLKPNSTITIAARCLPGDAKAMAKTSFGAEAQLGPASDADQLIGRITAPDVLGPGPVGGQHTVTVTCESGVSSTATFPTPEAVSH